MARNTHKKVFAGMLALSAGLVLAACDPIAAVPTKYQSAIVKTDKGAIDLDENNLGTLYDKIATEKNEKVVQQILAELAERKFGSYKELLEAKADATKKATFLKNHKAYFGEKEELQNKRFTDFVTDIDNRINAFFYNEITSGSYDDDLGRFSEKKLYNKHRYELYDLGAISENNFKTFYVDKQVTKENAFEKLNTAAYKLVSPDRGYIQEKVYPDILKNKLVEDYIFSKNYTSLGRAYGRKINFVKVAYEDGSSFEENLVYKYAERFITKNNEGDFEVLANSLKGFVPAALGSTNVIENIHKQTDAESVKVSTLLEDAGYLPSFPTADEVGYKEFITVASNDDNFKYGKLTIVPEGKYFVDTKLGKILKDYEKAIRAEKAGRFASDDDKPALEDFLKDGKSKEYGLLEKVKALVKEDYTTDGWFVKSDGPAELTSAIKDRLFNIRVANVLDDSTQLFNEVYSDTPEESTIGKHEEYYESKNQRLPYLRSINGKKFMLTADALSYEGNQYNYVYNDRSGSAFYICEVLEAPSTSKLDIDSDTVYGAKSAFLKEQIGRQIAKILGTKDSYIKDAYTEELNKFKDWSFYDSSLYDYLKSEYPDLSIFDDD